MKLLNKLKSDRQDLITNLIENIASLEKIAFEQQAEIERLKAEADCADGYAEALVEKAKSEAIKEFEDKLKQTFDKAINGIPKGARGYSLRGAILHDTHLIIDHVKKEMVGDDNA